MSTYGLSSSSSPFSTSTSIFGGFCSGNNRRPSMFTAKYRQREERKKVLKLSLNKVKRIEDPESFLRRSVLINNTIKRLQREVREEKMMRHGSNGGSYFSKLSLHSSFRKGFTSSKLNDINLCASAEDLMYDDIPLSPPSPTIIPSLPCISTTTTSFTSSAPSSTTCQQLDDPLSDNTGIVNSSDINSRSSDLLNGSNSNNNNNSNLNNSRKRNLSDDSEDDCDVDAVLSQIYIPPTPCIISSIDDEDCSDSASISNSSSTNSATETTGLSSSSSSSTLSADCCTASEPKKPRLSSDDLIMNEDGNDNYSVGSRINTNGSISYRDTLVKSFSSSPSSLDTSCNTISFSTSTPSLSSPSSSSSLDLTSSVDTIVHIDGEDVDIDVDVVGDCETSDWPTLPTHYESTSSTSTTIITTTSTVTTTTTTNSCLTIPIHQFSLDDELDLSTPSPSSINSDPFDSIPDAVKSASSSPSSDIFESFSDTYKSGCGALEERNNGGFYTSCNSSHANCEASQRNISNTSKQRTEEDEMGLSDNGKENTCVLPFYCPSSTSSSSSTCFPTAVAYCCSSITSAPSSSDQKCSNSPFTSSSNVTSDSISCSNSSLSSTVSYSPNNNAMIANNSNASVTNNNNNNNGPDIDDSSLDKQPPASPSQYSSCGHSTIFGELQSVVFHSLITSLET